MITKRILSTSSLTGNTVKNATGETLGDIKDFVIDTETGRVMYAVLSFGGFLGLGDKLFAIPVQAMELDTDDHAFILNVPKDRLEDAPGFDKDNWPSTSDYDWVNSVYAYYGYEPYYAEAIPM